jgi:hypothetical protein
VVDGFGGGGLSDGELGGGCYGSVVYPDGNTGVWR